MAASVGLNPLQFWRLTPHEFNLYVEGARDRRDNDMEALAWLQANIMNVWAKTKVRASQLFKRRDAPPEFTDAESLKAYMRAQLAEHEGE